MTITTATSDVSVSKMIEYFKWFGVASLGIGSFGPVCVDTDVNAAAWGEYRFGTLQGLKSGLYLTVGTGIGGGVVIDGKLLHGMLHPEMGHVLLERREDDDTPSICRCHANCAEGLAAGPMLSKRTGLPGRCGWNNIIIFYCSHKSNYKV